MRVDPERKSVDMEKRDIDYMLQSYVRLYLFESKNAEPDVITFPMFQSAPHPYKKGVRVPIQYVPELSPIALDIAQDGVDIPEATPESEAAADKKEDEYNAMKARIAELESEVARASTVTADDLEQEEADKQFEEDTVEDATPSLARTAFAGIQTESAIAGISPDQPTPERLAKVKEPEGGALPPGTQSDYGGRRDSRDQNRIARDLMPEKEINEDEEREDSSIVERAKGSKKNG